MKYCVSISKDNNVYLVAGEKVNPLDFVYISKEDGKVYKCQEKNYQVMDNIHLVYDVKLEG